MIESEVRRITGPSPILNVTYATYGYIVKTAYLYHDL